MTKPKLIEFDETTGTITAEEYVKKIMADLRSRLVYNSQTGEIKNEDPK